MSPVGKTKDVGWEIGVSRTVPHDADEVWKLLTSPTGVGIWLGEGLSFPAEPGAAYKTADGTVGEVRSFRPGDRLRLTWQPPDWSHDSTVQVAISPAKAGTTINFHQERLADSDEREAQRAHWSPVIERLRAELDRA